MTNHNECPYCRRPTDAGSAEAISRVLSGFLTTDQITELDAQLLDGYTGDEADLLDESHLSRLHPRCLTQLMAEAV